MISWKVELDILLSEWNTEWDGLELKRMPRITYTFLSYRKMERDIPLSHPHEELTIHYIILEHGT